MSEHRNRSSLLAYADSIASQVSAWSEEKRSSARRITSSIISPFPQSIDFGPHAPHSSLPSSGARGDKAKS